MNPARRFWWALPALGVPLGLLFHPDASDVSLPPPATASVEVRVLALSDGSALRFLRGPDMSVYLSETEVPADLWGRFSDSPPSHRAAGEFCAWLGRQTGARLRLPDRAEWLRAARAGVDNADFAWGFGPPVPPKDLQFALNQPPDRPGPAFGYGFRDLAGGRWEWTREGGLVGGAWSEHDPQILYPDHVWIPPPGYADHDVGVRLVWEEAEVPGH